MWDKYWLYIFLCRFVLRKDRVRRIACGVWQPHLRISLVCRSKGVEQTFAPPASACLCVPLLKTSMSAIWEGKRKNCVVCINQNQNLPQRWIISQVPPAAASYCQNNFLPTFLHNCLGFLVTVTDGQNIVTISNFSQNIC